MKERFGCRLGAINLINHKVHIGNSMPKDKKTSSYKEMMINTTKVAVKEAIYTSLHGAVISSDVNGEIKLDANLIGSTAKDAVKNAVMNLTFKSLCQNGYAVSMTCESMAPGTARYYFDFNTKKGHERIVVGVEMGTDRVGFLLKKVGNAFKSWGR